MSVPVVPAKRQNIQPIDGDLTGTSLTGAINDRIRRINQALGGDVTIVNPPPSSGGGGGTGLLDVYQDPASHNIGIGPEFDAAHLPNAPLQVGYNGDAPLASGFEQIIMSSGQGLLCQTNEPSSWGLVGYNSATGNEVDIAGPYGIVVKSGGVQINETGTPHNSLDIGDGGGIYIADSAAGQPANTVNALYSESGKLWFNGQPLGLAVAGHLNYLPIYSPDTASLGTSSVREGVTNGYIGIHIHMEDQNWPQYEPECQLTVYDPAGSTVALIDSPSAASTDRTFLRVRSGGQYTGIAGHNSNYPLSDDRSVDYIVGHYGAAGACLQFLTGVNEAMRIDANGRVGIGSTAPVAQLQVRNKSGTPHTLHVGAGGPDLELIAGGTGSNNIGSNLYSDPVNGWTLRDSTRGGWLMGFSVNTSNTGFWTLVHSNAGAVSLSEVLRVTAQADIGVAGTTPQCRLDFGTSAANAKIVVGAYMNGDAWTGLGLGASNPCLRFAGDPAAITTTGMLCDFGVYSVDSAHVWSSIANIDGQGNLNVAGGVAADFFVARNTLRGKVNVNRISASAVQTIDRYLSEKLAEATSIADFGVTGSNFANGIVDETAKVQNAVDTMQVSVNGGYLMIPAGMTIFTRMINLPSGIRIIGQGEGFCGFYRYDLSSTNPIFHIPSGSSNIELLNFTIDGRIGDNVSNSLLATQRIASNGGDPSDPRYWNYSSITMDQGVSNILFRRLTITHSGGYAIFGITNNGMISKGITVDSCQFLDNKPTIVNATGSYPGGVWTPGTGVDNGGSWNGGVCLECDGRAVSGPTGGYYLDVVISNNTWARCTGTCWWTHVYQPVDLKGLSRNVYFIDNYMEDIALDGSQPTSIDGYIETGNEAVRFGYLTLKSDGSDRKAVWGDGPVAFDTAGVLLNFVRNGNEAMGNGEMFDLDGAGFGTINGNVFISSFVSSDPLVGPTSAMGPGSAPGQNWTRFVNTGNTFNFSSLIGTYLIMTGNEIYGAGGGAFSCFGMQHSRIANNIVSIPATYYQTPVAFGNYSYQHATGNNVVYNSFRWNGSSGGGPCIAEVNSAQAWASGTTYSSGQLVNYSGNVYASLANGNVGHTPSSSPTWWYATYPYAPFTSSDRNHVWGNAIRSLGSASLYQFAKDPGSGSGDDNICPYIAVPSLTAAAQGIVETRLLTTGTNNATVQTQVWISAAPNTVIDQYNQVVGATPVNTQVLTLTPVTASVPSLTIANATLTAGVIDQAANFTGNSLTINNASDPASGAGPIINFRATYSSGKGNCIQDFWTYAAGQSVANGRYAVLDASGWSTHHTWCTSPPGTANTPVVERMRLTAVGWLGIGVSAPSDQIANTTGNPQDGQSHGNTAGQGITIVANAVGYAAVFGNNSTASGAGGLLVKNSTTSGRVATFMCGGAEILTLASPNSVLSGNLTVTGTLVMGTLSVTSLGVTTLSVSGAATFIGSLPSISATSIATNDYYVNGTASHIVDTSANAFFASLSIGGTQVITSGRVLQNVTGMVCSGGVQATGFNLPGGVYGANVNIGVFISGGVARFYNRAIGTGTPFDQITVQGGVITGLA
jgi:hypothetical protein